MPSLVHAKVSAPTYLRIAQTPTLQEDQNGLVTVNMMFVGKASDRALIYPQFHTDAAPPIYPQTVDANTLRRRSLFMSEHSYYTFAGLMYVNATYVGVQDRFVPTGRFIKRSVIVEGPFTRTLVGQTTSLTVTQGGGQSTTTFTPFAQTVWNRYVYIFELAVLNGDPVPSQQVLQVEKLLEIISNSAVTYEQNPLFSSGATGEPPTRPVWWNVASKTTGLVSAAPVQENDYENITDTVQILRTRIFVPGGN